MSEQPPIQDEDLAKVAQVIQLAVKSEAKKARGEARKKRVQSGADEAPWQIALTRGRDDAVMSRVSNGVTILRNHEAWKGVLAFDTFNRRIVFASEPPLDPDDRLPGEVSYPHPLDDSDYTRVGNWLERSEFNVSLSVGHLRDSVDITARHHQVHPVRDYLDGLIWDGQHRVDSWLVTFCGVKVRDCASEQSHPMPTNPEGKRDLECLVTRTADEDDFDFFSPLRHASCPAHKHAEYIRLVGRYWLISAVARIFEPGCKADAMLILEGPQYSGKSTAFRILASDNWFFDSKLDIDGGKETYMSLHGKWIVEIPELADLLRGDPEGAKAFLSAQYDEYVPKWGRERIAVPRECIFGGSCNFGRYLRDPSGGRRYWSVKAGDIELATLRAARDQLWAEAVHLYRGADSCEASLSARFPDLLSSMDVCKPGHRCHRHRWWPVKDEHHALFAPQQELRAVGDMFDDVIEAWLARDENRAAHSHRLPDGSREWRLSRELVRHTVLNLQAAQLPKGMGMRVEEAMERLGFKEALRGERGRRNRFWVRAAPQEE